MLIESIDEPAEFLRRTTALRAAEPVLTNVIGTVAQSVVDGGAQDDCWWWLVTDEVGEPVACAMRTAPWNLALSPMPAAAAGALGRAVARTDPTLPGVVGPSDAVHALVAALPTNPGVRITMREVVHVLGTLIEPSPVPGHAVHADQSELELLVEWHEEFARETGLPHRDLRRSIAQRLELGGLVWWQVDGEPVSLAGHTAPLSTPSGTVGRIGPVFTPAPFRRRGYAAAVTAAVARRLEPSCTVVMLFTDAANATSNRVYQRLGFRPVAELIEVELLPAQ